AGANSDCKPEFLLQFAQMGSVYMERVMGVANPRIGLLSNGSEDTKGTHLVQDAHKLLRHSGLNFIGNIEGQEISRHTADVIVTDGFTGNIVVKVSEGFNEMVFDRVKEAASSAIHLGIAASILKPTFQSIAKTLDYTEHGGAVLLGTKGNVIIAHGRSEAKAIKNAISAARRAIEQGLPEALEI
ncbi:MAG: phosphate--acyl-ACP acyltransferase, partial [Dehalococcoidia bacterium]|nr:phosphate--acyl-ACP acyltransferase [Dehalococcoidia bacterium]